MPDFTPGPWVVEDYGVGIFSRSGDCSIVDLAEANSDKEKIANARLIAAAPEMYRILCDISKWCEYDDLDPDIEEDIAEVLEAVHGREDNSHETDA